MKNNILILALITITIIVIVKKCEKEPEVIIETETKTIIKTDTITNLVISKPDTVHINHIKTIKGKDSIVYVDKPNDTSIPSHQYQTQLESNQAKANLKVTTTGELLDVTGTITYPEKETVKTITKIKPKSGLFLYGETSINPLFERAEIGLDYQIKNTVIIGTSTSYDNISKSVNFNVKLGFRIF